MASEKSKTLLKLFTSTLYISAFTFGGGFVIITFMKKKFVDEYHWIEENEMLDLAALAQSSPGAIAVNAAILVGWRMGGFPGMLTAVFGTIIPPMALLLLKGMQAGVAAGILDVVCGLGKGVLKNKDIVHMIVMAAAFLATFVWGVNVIYIILAAAFAGICTELWKRKGGKER